VTLTHYAMKPVSPLFPATVGPDPRVVHEIAGPCRAFGCLRATRSSYGRMPDGTPRWLCPDCARLEAIRAAHQQPVALVENEAGMVLPDDAMPPEAE